MDKQGLVTMIVDILRNKQEMAAQGPGMVNPANAALQQRSSASQLAPSAADAALQQRSGASLLGNGAAGRAGQMVSGRDKQIMDYVNQAGR